MAESVVTFVVENLVRLLKEEVTSLRGVKKQVVSLEKKLAAINTFLQRCENREGSSENGQEAYIEQIREAAREAEGVIDKYMVHVLKQSRRNMVVKLLHLLDVRDVPNTITSIKESLEENYQNNERFPGRQPGGQQQPPVTNYRSALEVDQKDVGVGFGDHITKLVSMLLPDENKNTKRDVVSITGMGGSGKTKLAINIFYSNPVQLGFKSRAFVSGSREYTAENWLDKTLKELKYNCDTANYNTEQLVETLLNQLQRRKYLVVMDGMWDNQVWNVVRNAFPDDTNGSRILITSREKVVASKDDYTFPPYQLPLLDEAESWQLLRNRVFQPLCLAVNDEGEDLTHIGQQLAKNCNGLPLSIVELGDLLKTRSILIETWSDIGDIKDKHEEKCLGVVAESYKQLPRHLKVCFLYLGLFPKDFEISARQLIQLWSAEGFIKTSSGSRDAIKVAEERLQELIDRNLIRVTSWRSDGGVKTCCIHDLIRKLSKSESKKEKFLEVHDSDDYETSPKLARTLSIQGNACQYISSYDNHRSPPARSLFLFGNRASNFKLEQWQIIYKSFKHTRTLYFWDVRVQSIPKEIEKLIYLTYIRIGSDAEVLKIPALPASICNLPYLETIEINGQIEETLPERIWRMKQLRHLKVSKGMRLPDPFPSSTSSRSRSSSSSSSSNSTNNLRILYGLLVHKNTNSLMARVPNEFPNVEKLYLLHDVRKPFESETEVTELFKSLQSLQRLRGLKIVNFPKSSNLFPSTLEKITIISSYLNSEHFKILGELGQLRFLKIRKIHNSFTTPSKLSCRRGSFPKLEVFQMIDLNIEKWKMDRSAMPKLRRLVINGCYQLLCLPVELWSLPNLVSQNVEVSQMSEYFTKFPSQELGQGQLVNFNYAAAAASAAADAAAADAAAASAAAAAADAAAADAAAADASAAAAADAAADAAAAAAAAAADAAAAAAAAQISLIQKPNLPIRPFISSSFFLLFSIFLSVFFALSTTLPWVS